MAMAMETSPAVTLAVVKVVRGRFRSRSSTKLISVYGPRDGMPVGSSRHLIPALSPAGGDVTFALARRQPRDRALKIREGVAPYARRKVLVK